MPTKGPLTPLQLDAYAEGPDEGVVWHLRTDELDLNLVAWSAGHGVSAHVNAACDVLLVGLRGEGELRVDDTREAIESGTALVIPKGARRSIRAEGRLLYLSCHRRQPETFSSETLR